MMASYETSEITAQDVVFECPNCGKNMVIDGAAAGLMVECVGCRINVIVPQQLVPNAGQWTPLMVAAHTGNRSAVKELIEGGANVHQVSADGMTALKLAEQAGHFDIVRLLWKAGAKG